MNRFLVGVSLLFFIGVGAFSSATAKSFRPFWDFRQWGEAGHPSKLYLDYMNTFSRQGITALILIARDAKPPFPEVRRFLADAARQGVRVWVRTNRVSPKRGIPNRPNSTLDFVLDDALQKDTLDYLLALAALSKDYPNFAGLVIGGEELVGMRITRKVLERFSIKESLSDAEKIKYFDWLQDLHNAWYGRIWDTLRPQYPDLDLLIYPSSGAVCGGGLSQFPRPAYWDIYDLIVTRKKYFGIILPSYTVEDPLGSHQTAAFGLYLRAATQDLVPYYLLLQVHRTEGSRHTPTPEELQSQFLAAVESGASGVGYWPHDVDQGKKDVYETGPSRCRVVFQAMDSGSKNDFRPPPRTGQGLYILKPRYSQYWRRDNHDTLRTLASLHRAGLAPEFLLAEQIVSRPLPPQAKFFYLPETFQYESDRVFSVLLASGKPVFFGLDAAEAHTPDKRTLPPFYDTLKMKKIAPSTRNTPPLQEGIASYAGTDYHLLLRAPSPSWDYPKEMALVHFRVPAQGKIQDIPLAYTDGRLIFFASSDYQFLLSAGENNQNNQFIKNLIENFSRETSHLGEKGQTHLPRLLENSRDMISPF